MKKNLIYILLFFIIKSQIFAADMKRVFINQFVDHPALNMTAQGIIDGLSNNGYVRGVNLDLKLESSQASFALASQISAKFVSQNADVIVAVATIPAQIIAKYAKSKQAKLVFSSVTDPLSAGLVENLEIPGGNISGVSNFVDLDPQIELFKKIQPNLKKIGFLYNPGEMNSTFIADRLQKICPKFGIALILQTANKTSDIAQAAAKLASNVDAIFISNDSTALSSLKIIIDLAARSKVPVYVSDTDAVELGALAALGPNQYQVGLQTAQIITRVLEGEDIANISVEFPAKTELYLNIKQAAKLGIEFSDDLLKKAEKIL